MFGWLKSSTSRTTHRRIRRRLSFEPLEHRRVFAAGFGEFVDPHPAPGNQFGASVVPLATGNVVITSPYDDAGGTDAGAVYLFSGRTGTLISTLTGSHADDHVGSGGVTALTNGNFVVASPDWDSDTTQDVGAATWGSGMMGVSGVVSVNNSLVGSSQGDKVTYSSVLSPSQAAVAALANGNYVVFSPQWDNGTVVDAGAATWGDGAMGVHGEVSSSNSLVGSSSNDQVGLEGAAKLTNGNYVVISRFWDNGSAADAGAATWGDGTIGVNGPVTEVNSLVGTMSGDKVGIAFALPNGNYIAVASKWHTVTGAVTFGNGTTGVTGPVSADNSLVGSTPGDGNGTFKILSNGNYVVDWFFWTNGSAKFAGAVTFGSGTTGVRGVAGPDISLVGTTAFDEVGSDGVTALDNGNYTVGSPQWDNGPLNNVGAVTFGDGMVGVHGTIDSGNSLVGASNNDQVSSNGVTALPNGDYVVASPGWDDGGIADVGAVTLGNGLTGTFGNVNSSNSLVGDTAGDQVGGPVASGGVLALTNGNYVVRSPLWDNGSVQDAGAVTFGNGLTGATGQVSTANSLIGGTAGDEVGSGSNGSSGLALANGNYVVSSPNWDDGAITDVGAVTFGNGQTGTVGTVSENNSLVGSTANDQVGGGANLSLYLAPLTNGNYIVGSPNWDNNGIVDAGAATFGSGTAGISGVVSAANSLVGSNPNDQVSQGSVRDGLQRLTNGNYLIVSATWDNGPLQDAGAVTFGDGLKGIAGPINASNSAIGGSASSNLQQVILDAVNQSFYVRFLNDGGGRVVVGSQIDGFAHPWHLAAKPEDVTNDGIVAPNDLTKIILYLNGYGASDVPANPQIGQPFGFLDVTGDDQVAPNDLTKVISYLNAFGAGEGEDAVQSPMSNVQGQDAADAGSVDQLLMLLAMDASQRATRKK